MIREEDQGRYCRCSRVASEQIRKAEDVEKKAFAFRVASLLAGRMAVAIVLACLIGLSAAYAGFPRGRLPDFDVRFRVQPEDKGNTNQVYSIALRLSTKSVTTKCGEWSPWIRITDADMNPQASSYPNSSSRTWPARIMFLVTTVTGPTHVAVETKVGDYVVSSSADLTGASSWLGFAVMHPPWEKVGQATTLGRYNQDTFWTPIRKLDEKLPLRGKLPGKISLIDHFRVSDGDITSVKDAIRGMRLLGMSGIDLSVNKETYAYVKAAGFTSVSLSVYQPPGEDGLTRWASGLAKAYSDAGVKLEDVSFCNISDEPGWYYPSAYKGVNENPARLKRFHAYLQEQGFKPRDVGAETWETVRVVGRSKVKTLPERRLAYWSQRYFPYESSLYFARCRKAMEDAFYPGIPLGVNWNFFAGRSYCHGAFGNNPDKKHPEAAMAGHDWFEFCRLGGTTCPWTEDWFGDEQAYQWSFYAEKLWSASTNGVFGGFIVPRSSGSIPTHGLTYKTLALVGHGAKIVKYFTFGPEYDFPGNCWSQMGGVPEPMMRASRLVGAAEDLLYPGKPVQRQVGILHHLSSQMWDWGDIVDATNPDLNKKCAAYTAEMFDIYLALMHRQVPVEFVSEEDVIAGAIDHLKVIYVTEPNVPEEAQKRLAAWVKKGGVLVTTSQAATLDRYDMSSTILDDVRGIKEDSAAAKMVFGSVLKTSTVAWWEGELGNGGGIEAGACVGGRGKVTLTGAEVVGRFNTDKTPAITRHAYGKGLSFHMAFLPGISYRVTLEGGAGGKFPVDGKNTANARDIILLPVETARVVRPVEVDRPFVEAPVLASDQGLAITLLNWTNEKQKAVKLRIRTDRRVRLVESASAVPVKSVIGDGWVEATLDVEAVDVLKVWYAP